MKGDPTGARFGKAGYRLRVLITMKLVVTTLTVIAIVLAERTLTSRVEERLQQSYLGELSTVQRSQELRQAALLERVRTLVKRARIHAAIEDDALDLLYPSAKDELRDLMARDSDALSAHHPAYSLRAQFYRFLDRYGRLIPVAPTDRAGTLSREEEESLPLPAPPRPVVEIGYVNRTTENALSPVSEIITAPIVSFENGDIIAALVLGFETSSLIPAVAEGGLRRGVWLDGRLHMTAVSEAQREALSDAIRQGAGPENFPESGVRRNLAGEPHLIFVKQLNPNSAYPPAYDVIAYPLAALAAQKSRVRWQVIGIGCLVLGAGLALSHALSRRLTRPVEQLADDSDRNRIQREKAEAELQSTHAELQRAARFSADASHQLKTPVAVLRAGLEQLRSNGEISPDTIDEIGTLIHQTYRLSSVIEDLLLLSRMDAGRLELTFRPVDVSRILDAAVDDFSAQPDADTMVLSSRYPPALMVSGEQKYISLIVGNLIDNARKYNRPGGRIDVSAWEQDGATRIRIGNNGHTIDGEGQRHIFERFHRASMGENVPGYGLGLNLARELARLHHGDVILLQSQDDWTEFEVRFRTSHTPHPSPFGA